MRAYGIKICTQCNELYTANTYYFPNLIDQKTKQETDAPTCFKCLKEMTKKRNHLFVEDFYNELRTLRREV